jgi:transcriptional regulator with XRE-family HTH domain
MALDAKKSAAVMRGASAPIIAGEPPKLPTGELPSGKPQSIIINGETMVVMPKADYDVLIEAARDNIEDLADAKEAIEILRRIERGEEGILPGGVVQRLGRENRVKVLREHRGLTQAELAEKVGSDRLYISQIETGARRGGLDLLGNIAAALEVPIDLVVPKPQDADAPVGIAELSERSRGYRAKPRSGKPGSRKK